MQAERDELTTWVFPKLRALCESRGIAWREVDLRWGITDELRLDGQVVPICLSEIDACRPYFIGILGDRYGTECDAIPNVLRKELGLSESSQVSMTEIEFEYGALLKPQQAHRTYFYLRSPEYAASQPEPIRTHLSDQPTTAEIRRLGKTKATQHAAERAKKLVQLKHRVANSGLPTRTYAEPRILGQLVYQDLAASIESDFPDQTPTEPLAEDLQAHASFARSRARIFLTRPKLSQHITPIAGSAFVLAGDSGVGKSTLLVNWIEEQRRKDPHTQYAQYYIGASTRSGNWRHLIQSICWQLGEPLHDPPLDAEMLRREFRKALDRIAVRANTIIVIDALNQLEARDGARELIWLPPVLPSQIHLVVSSLPGISLDECRRRQYTELHIPPLTVTERKRLTTTYLKGRYAKTLALDHLDRLVQHPQSGSPLWLITVLEELRLYGDHHTLTLKIDHYLSAPTIEGLFALVLERWQQDYDRDRPHFVRDAMRALWAARRGLSATEICHLLGYESRPIPSLFWATFIYAADHALLEHSGAFTFAHIYLRKAVEQRFLTKASTRKTEHRKLARFFASSPTMSRRIDELPWQLEQARRWKDLFHLLSDIDFFRSAWARDELDVKAFWETLEQNSRYSRLEAYAPLITRPKAYPKDAAEVATLLKQSGHLSDALRIYQHLAVNLEGTAEVSQLAKINTAIGQIADVLGDRPHALECHRQAEEVFRNLGEDDALIVSLGEQAHIAFGMADNDQALSLLKEATDLAERINQFASLHALLVSRAEIEMAVGNLTAAHETLDRAETICIQLGDRDGLQRLWGHRAKIFIVQERYDKAMHWIKQKETIALELGDRVSQASALATLSHIMDHTNQYDEALRLNKQAEALYCAVGDELLVAEIGANRSTILLNISARDNRRDLFKEAKELLAAQEKAYKRLGEKQELSTCLHNQAIMAWEMGETAKAIKLYERAAERAASLDQWSKYANSLCEKARCLNILNEGSKAYKILKEAFTCFQKQSDILGSAYVLRIMSEILLDHSHHDEALNAARWSLRLGRESGSATAIARAMEKLGQALESTQSFEEAIIMYESEVDTWEQAGNLTMAATACGNVVRLAGQLGNVSKMLETLSHQAAMYVQIGKAQDMVKKIEEVLERLQGRAPLDANDAVYLKGLEAIAQSIKEQS